VQKRVRLHNGKKNSGHSRVKVDNAKKAILHASQKTKKKNLKKNMNKKLNRKKKLKASRKKSSLNKKHKLNHSASVQRGVKKIFKGFKINKRKSAAYKVMAHNKKGSNKLKNKKSNKSKNILTNARVINTKNKSFTQISTNR